MSNDYTFLGIFLIITLIFPLGGIGTAFLLRPKKPGQIKNETYECGLETIGDSWVQFKVQYYLFAIIFVIFDVEAVFLFPWAVTYNQLGLYAFGEMVIFLGVLLAGLLYAWRKGALEWV